MPHNHPEPLEPQSFDYTALNAVTKIFVQDKTKEIKRLIRRSAQDIFDIGQGLIEVKERLGHGSFRRWLRTEFTWSIPAANKFMQVAQKFKSINFIHLDIAASALYLLAAPSTPEEARQEALERAFQGERITSGKAKEIVYWHTIDATAKTIEDDEQPDTRTTPLAPLDTLTLNTKPVDKSASVEENDLLPNPEPEQPKGQRFRRKPKALAEAVHINHAHSEDLQSSVSPSQYAVGDRVRILCRQHGEDNWTDKIAKIWQITPDGWLRVDVEGHPGVKFTLKPEWVERMPEEIPEHHSDQPEQALDEDWANKPDPESSALVDAPSEVQTEGEATPQFRAGDRLQVTNLGKSNQQWTGDVAEVVEAAEGCIKVVVEIRTAV